MTSLDLSSSYLHQVTHTCFSEMEDNPMSLPRHARSENNASEYPPPDMQTMASIYYLRGPQLRFRIFRMLNGGSFLALDEENGEWPKSSTSQTWDLQHQIVTLSPRLWFSFLRAAWSQPHARSYNTGYTNCHFVTGNSKPDCRYGVHGNISTKTSDKSQMLRVRIYAIKYIFILYWAVYLPKPPRLGNTSEDQLTCIYYQRISGIKRRSSVCTYSHW
jgi:hypothetical protein